MKQATKHRALLALWLLLPASSLLAAGGEGGGNNIFAGDLGNVLWTLLTFGLALFVLGKFAWGPILENLQKREQFIHDSLEQARRQRDEAEARLKELEERLAAARAEATEIVEEGRRDAEVVRRRIEDEARGEAETMVARAKREIDLAKTTAVKELYTTSGHLATEIAGRIVGRELKAEDHQRLIQESIDELGQTEAN